MMVPFGLVIPMPVSNTMILQDTAGNLQRIIATMTELEGSSTRDRLTYTCKYVLARYAEEQLKRLLYDPNDFQRDLNLERQLRNLNAPTGGGGGGGAGNAGGGGAGGGRGGRGGLGG